MINAISTSPTNPNTNTNSNPQTPLSPIGVPPVVPAPASSANGPIPPATLVLTPFMPMGAKPLSPMGQPIAAPMMPAVSTAPIKSTPVTVPSTSPVTSSPVTAAVMPQRPDLRENKTSINFEKATVSAFGSGTGSSNSVGGNSPAGTSPIGKPKKKVNFALIGSLVALFILFVGGGVGLFLSGKSQETRQQASTGTATPGCNTTCSTDLDCPAAHSCSSSTNKCVLSACLASGVSCDTNKCVITNSAACSLSFVATAFSCNASCTSNAQCQTVNSNYVCDTAGSNTCRLNSNLTSTTCAAAPTYACNKSCSTDAQCQTVNANYVCDTAGSNTCRMKGNLTSTSCAEAPITCATGSFNDSFAGSTLDSRYTPGGVGAATVANNLLNISIPATSSADDRYGIQVTRAYTGDFETTITDAAFNAPNANQGLIRLAVTNLSNTATVNIDLNHITGGNVQIFSYGPNVASQSTSVMAYIAPTKLKIVRAGTTFTTYYAVNSNIFTKLAEYTVPADTFTIRAVTRGDGTNTSVANAAVTSAYSNFSLSCPIPAAITCTNGAFDDSFSGSALNARYTIAGQGTGTVANNQLVNTIPTSATTDPRFAIQTAQPYLGDFETTLTDATLNSPNDNQGLVRLAVTNSSGSTGVYIDLVHATGGNVYAFAAGTNLASASSAVIPYVSPAKIKMARTGTTFSMYYSINSSTFTKLVDYTLPADTYFVRAVTRADGSNTTTSPAVVTAAYSNFSLVCPPPPTYTCNGSCTTDAQCQQTNSAWMCDTAGSKTCRLSSNKPSTTCTPVPTTYTCNSSCNTDAQCQTANASWVCDANNGNICRLDSNRTDNTCTPPVNTYACNSSCTTDAQCQTANSSYVCSNNMCRLSSNTTSTSCQPTVPVVVTPAVGCNQTCATNADCSATNQICAQTADGLKCRLDNYVNSDTCTPPGTVSVTTVVASTPQPVKPSTLPNTGSVGTTIRFVLMGAGAVVLGALGLLLL